MNTINIDKNSFIAICSCLKESNISDVFESKEDNEYKILVCGTIMYLLNFIFGESKCELIFKFINKDKDNKFSTIDELYDYIIDPYSSLVTTDSVLTLSQLVKLFPNEDIFKFFEKSVKDAENRVPRKRSQRS